MKHKKLSILLISLIIISSLSLIRNFENLKKNENGDPQKFYANLLKNKKNKKHNENLLSFSNRHIYGKESSKLDNFFRKNSNTSNINKNLRNRNEIITVRDNNNNKPISNRRFEKRRINQISIQPAQKIISYNKIQPKQVGTATNFEDPSDKTESDPLIDKITEQTERILKGICSSSKGLSESLDHILHEMKAIKDHIKVIEHENFSKQKMYVKYTKLANDINISTSELLRLGDILEMLKNSNCENLGHLGSKFTTINSIPSKLIGMLKKSFKRENIKIGLAIIS